MLKMILLLESNWFYKTRLNIFLQLQRHCDIVRSDVTITVTKMENDQTEERETIKQKRSMIGMISSLFLPLLFGHDLILLDSMVDQSKKKDDSSL